MKKRNLIAFLNKEVNRQSFPDGRINLLLQQFDTDRIAFQKLIEMKPEESKIQSFLEEHPVILIHAMLDGFYPAASARSALFSKISLGTQYEIDFAYCNWNSAGVWWTFVELERSEVPLFSKAGDPSKYLTHAMRQVMDWQAWVNDHTEYACSELANLVRDDPWVFQHTDYLRRPCSSVIVIGRRASLSRETNRRRAQLCYDKPKLEIITYDRLFDDYNIGKEEQIDGAADQIRNITEM